MTVLPPGEWDPSIRIEPPDVIPEQGKRLESAKSGNGGDDEEHDPAGDREEQLQKTGRLEGKKLDSNHECIMTEWNVLTVTVC